MMRSNYCRDRYQNILITKMCNDKQHYNSRCDNRCDNRNGRDSRDRYHRVEIESVICKNGKWMAIDIHGNSLDSNDPYVAQTIMRIRDEEEHNLPSAVEGVDEYNAPTYGWDIRKRDREERYRRRSRSPCQRRSRSRRHSRELYQEKKDHDEIMAIIYDPSINECYAIDKNRERMDSRLPHVAEAIQHSKWLDDNML